MTASRDPDRLIHAFLQEGAEQLADPIYDVVRAEIERTRQRVVIGPWRLPTMNKLVPLGLGVAAVVVVAVIGTRLLPSSTSSGVGVAPPSVAPSVAPSAVASPSVAVSPSLEGEAPQGPFALTYATSTLTPGVATSVTITGPGWVGDPGVGILTKGGVADAPAGAGMIGPWMEPLYVFGDPCHWSSTTPKTPAATVDAVMTALTAQKSRDASAPVAISLDGHPGKRVTLHVPTDADFSKCDSGQFGSWSIKDDPTPSRYHQDPGQIDEVWVVDLGGKIAVVDAAYYAGTPTEDVAQMRAMVQSMTFN